MYRQGFLLGLLATGAQTLLLRELISTLNGSELFIGTAMFGWLLWTALGAFLGGKRSGTSNTRILMITAATALPIVIGLARLTPLAVTTTVGEMIPFSVAAIISILAALPLGLICGWLFPAIVKQSESARDPILRVYLVEGIGACVAGVGVSLLAGVALSNLAVAMLLGSIVIFGAVLPLRRKWIWMLLPIGILISLLPRMATEIDHWSDLIRYPGYEIVRSFDTPYTHETILRRDSTFVLMTDNTVESAYPDPQTAENLLLPALAYAKPSPNVWFVGRSEFGVAQIAEACSRVHLEALDQRAALGPIIDSLITGARFIRLDLDPVTAASSVPLDIVIVQLGDLGSFRTGRLVTREAVAHWHAQVSSSGLLMIATPYDTDRYLTVQVAEILGAIYRELSSQFAHVTVWPGSNTLLLASNTNLFDIPNDSLFARLDRMSYKPQFVHEIYLQDRLSEFAVNRLLGSLRKSTASHTVGQPSLVMTQTLYRSEANTADRFIAASMFEHPFWLVIVPLGLLGLFAFSIMRKSRYQTTGLLLYAAAGLISLVVELLAFYLYQSMVGSLYAQLAALVGTFMAGLAAGTYWSLTRKPTRTERLSLVLLTIALILVYAIGAIQSLPAAPILFAVVLFAAAATGGLFASATRRYYESRSAFNQGLGYALELTGSSLGALLTTTVLLPIIGLNWIVAGCLILVGLCAVGSLVASKP